MAIAKESVSFPLARAEVWKNLYLVHATDAEEAYQKAYRCGEAYATCDLDSLTLFGRPATGEFLGVCDMGMLMNGFRNDSEVLCERRRCMQSTARAMVSSRKSILLSYQTEHISREQPYAQWYLADLLYMTVARQQALRQTALTELDRVLVLVKASSEKEAYRKAIEMGKARVRKVASAKTAIPGRPTTTMFLGLRDLYYGFYDAEQDVVEILWKCIHCAQKTARVMVSASKEELLSRLKTDFAAKTYGKSRPVAIPELSRNAHGNSLIVKPIAKKPNRKSAKHLYWAWIAQVAIAKARVGLPLARVEARKDLYLIFANDAEEAYQKTYQSGKAFAARDFGLTGFYRRPTIGEFLGICGMGVVKDGFRSGSEVLWERRRCKQSTAQAMVRSRESILLPYQKFMYHDPPFAQWYLADLLYMTVARKQTRGPVELTVVESVLVLIKASDANEAYRQALGIGKARLRKVSSISAASLRRPVTTTFLGLRQLHHEFFYVCKNEDDVIDVVCEYITCAQKTARAIATLSKKEVLSRLKTDPTASIIN